MTEGKVTLKSAGPITFGPDGILFIADTKSAAIVAIATGDTKGGAAKAEVLSSALFGTISGSAVANVVATGIFTIPLMKKTGYSPEEAAAHEAVSSTGGQIMPPVMGIAAFVMAELLQVPYARIALAGVIPAVAYYFALYMIVDLRARHSGMGSISREELEGIAPVLPRIHLFIPPITLIAMLVVRPWGLFGTREELDRV